MVNRKDEVTSGYSNAGLSMLLPGNSISLTWSAAEHMLANVGAGLGV